MSGDLYFHFEQVFYRRVDGENVVESLRTTDTLLQRVLRIQDAMQFAGIEPIDMRRAGTLETDVVLPELGSLQDSQSYEIELLEGADNAIEQRVIPRQNESGFRWFIDGSQKTMPVWRLGVVPIVVSVAVAGLLERDDNGDCAIVPGTLAQSLVWIVPQQTGSPEIQRLVDILEGEGEKVEDPIQEQPNYHHIAGLYDHVLYYANEMAGKMRERAEFHVATQWQQEHSRRDPHGWLVIDGRLAIDAPNAIGLIKSPEGQHLVGPDAVTLLNLPAGSRTSAYRISGRSRARTHWYQRMWPADGLDARHALIRIEASGDMADQQEIDDIASWLMAERVPRPTSDSRWPTLLYPVHILERILKQRINQITSGWPV